MWIRITDLAHNRVALNTDQIIAIVIPSPITPGDGKCRIIGAGMILEVSRGEAQRLTDDLGTALLESAMPES